LDNILQYVRVNGKTDNILQYVHKFTINNHTFHSASSSSPFSGAYFRLTLIYKKIKLNIIKKRPHTLKK